MTSPLGLIAGLGELPVQIAQVATDREQGVYILRLKGFEEPALAEYPGEVVGIAEVGRILKAFKKAGCQQVCFAGIVKRPDFKALKPDLKGMSLLPKVLSAARKGDDALLRVLVETFEGEGFEVIGADEAAGNLKAGGGLLAGEQPDEAMLDDLRKGAAIASAVGRLDIGQGAIVCDGLVLCVEAQEGTDAMLARCAELDPKLLGTAQARRGVLVKRPKPIQERRIDLPTIGIATLEGAARAGLAGIGVEANGALLIGGEALVRRAEELGLFLYGFPEDWD
ncbi:UDP-2,3-diacylglucosamine diphosphatase LpxI [Hyphomonas sp. FCG-A18]|uniref:LpxI family protein n=1 Tax=Hyphomonas sp. FCG-A18 TaxID=3080019 RepID=UPI002B30CB5B|nr:UDP-2,3-diacylglucosamine diphosphatase LpxI [Hyphomonas sp. FCG-A18]